MSLKPIYNACGALAAVFMVAMLGFIMANVLGRIFDFYLRGADAYAGYCMAASSFLGLAYAFGHGDHIRVTLLLQRMTGARRRGFEIWCLAIAALLSAAFAFYSAKMVWWAWSFNDMSQANDATPLWIPQSSFAIGAILLFVAVLDELVTVLRGGRPAYEIATEERHARGDFTEDL